MKRGRNLYRASMYMESEFVWCNIKASWSNAYTEIYGANFQTASLSIGCIERKERMESIFLARLIRPSTLHLADSFTRISFLWLRTRHTSLPNSAFFLVARRQAEWYIKKKKKKKKKKKEREEKTMEERTLHLWEHLWELSVRALYASTWENKNAMSRNYARTIYRFLFSLLAILWLFGHRVNIRCLVSCCTWAQHRGLKHQFPLMRYIIESGVTFFSGSSHVTARNTCTRVLESTSLVTRLNAFNWKLYKGISSDGYKYGRAVDGDRVTNPGGKYVTLLNKMKKENG